MSCAVIWCKNNYKYNKNNKAFFQFPSNRLLRLQWLKFVGKSDPLTSYWRVCEDHFRKEDLVGKMQCDLGIQRMVKLRQGAVPTIQSININTEEIFDAGRQIVNNLDSYKLVEFPVPYEVVENQLAEVIPLYEDQYSYDVVASCSTVNQTEDREEQDPLGDSLVQYSDDMIIEVESSDDEVAECSTRNETEIEVEQQSPVESILQCSNQTQKTVNIECSEDDGALCSVENTTDAEVVQQPFVPTIIEYSCENQNNTVNVENKVYKVTAFSTKPKSKEKTEQNLVGKANYNARSIQYKTEIESLKLEMKTLQQKFNQLSDNVHKNEVQCESSLPKKEEKISGIAHQTKKKAEQNLVYKADYNTLSIREKTEIESLKLQIKTLEQKYNQLNNNVRKKEIRFESTLLKKEEKIRETTYLLRNMEERLKEIFTKGQIERLQMEKEKSWWAQEDFVLAKTIYSISPQFYKLLRKNKFLWPSPQTLQQINQIEKHDTRKQTNDEQSTITEMNL